MAMEIARSAGEQKARFPQEFWKKESKMVPGNEFDSMGYRESVSEMSAVL